MLLGLTIHYAEEFIILLNLFHHYYEVCKICTEISPSITKISYEIKDQYLYL